MSHMKDPTNAHTADINSVAGIKTEVMIITGRTKTRSKNTCKYATRALTNVRIVISGTVCSRVVYWKNCARLGLSASSEKKKDAEEHAE